MAYAKKAVTGFSWTSLAKIISTGLVVLKVAVTARLLTPAQIGLFSLTTIALGLMESFTETGINLTIIQSKQSVKYFVDTAWVVSIVRGLLIGSLMIVVGVLMQAWYNQPDLLFLVSLAALIPVVRGFINPAIVTFHKEMAFLSDGVYRVSLVFVETLAAVSIVYLTKSVFGLIVAMIVSAFFDVLITFAVVSVRPRFSFIASRAKTIFSNAKGLTLTSALSYLNENLDNLLLGKILGSTMLGLYHNGYSIGHKTYDVAKSVHHSTLPAYVAVSQDVKRLRRAFLKTSTVTLVSLSLLSLPLFFLPELVVSILLGDQWLNLVPALPILALAGLLQSTHMLCQTVFYTSRRYRYVYLSLLVAVITLAISMPLLASQYGLVGASLSIVLTRVLPLPILVYGLYDTLR